MADRHRPGYLEEFNAETYDNLRIRVRKDSGIRDALQEVLKDGESINNYVTTAIIQKLVTDGYMRRK